MKKKKGDKNNIALQMLNSCFSCHSPEAKNVMTAFANYAGRFLVSNETAILFLRILQTNEPEVVDALLKHRDPFHMFRNIKPGKEFIEKTFQILSYHNPESIYHKVLFALLGIVDMVYKNPGNGNDIYRVSIFDVNHLGKYLDERMGQSYEKNKVILRILENMDAPEYEHQFDDEMKTVALHAKRLRFAFFDEKHRLNDVVPDQLLTPRAKKTFVHGPAGRPSVNGLDRGYPDIIELLQDSGSVHGQV